MNDYLVIAGPTSEKLAQSISRKLKADYLKPEIKVFPDGEVKITINGKIKRKNIIIVSSTCPPVDSNTVQTLSLITKAREISENVIAVIPYMGYAKQDKEFLKGEIITISVIAKLLKAAGVTKLIVVDFHSPESLKYFKFPTRNISASSLLSNYLKKYKLKEPLVVSPDMFWKSNAKKFAKNLKLNSLALNKQRNRKTGNLIIKSKYPKFTKGGDLILFDDMISTGGSVLKAIKFLKRTNFRDIFVVCTHPVFVNGSDKKIFDAGVKEVIGTNSIEGKFSKVDLAEKISDAILNWK